MFTDIRAALNSHANAHPNSLAFTSIEEDSKSITIAELRILSEKIAKNLLRRVHSGDRAVVICESKLESIILLLSCVYAGVVAVPVPPLKNRGRNERMENILADSDAKLVLSGNLSSRSANNVSESPLSCSHSIPVFCLDELICEEIDIELPNIREENIAIIQYTSGSTGQPKGVCVTHLNIMENLRAISYLTGCSNKDVFVNWLPIFHDLGLINTIFLPVYLGAHSIIMSPVKFAKDPMCWIEAISVYRGTVCGGPNFAYELCIEKYDNTRTESLDLSCWRLAFNAAEPIIATTLDEFSSLFLKCGFDRRSLFSAYGLAEATAFVSGTFSPEKFGYVNNLKGLDVAQDAGGFGLNLVSCGKPAPLHDLKIISQEDGSILPELHIGEICISGPSVFANYWSRDSSKNEMDKVQVMVNSSYYFLTGDLGFIFNGDLYVCGRFDDVIQVRGKKYFPTDIERISYSLSNFFAPFSAAFMVNDLSQRIVLIQEVKRAHVKKISVERISEEVRACIASQLGISVEVHLIRQGALGRTSSGKIRRSSVREMYISGGLHFIEEHKANIERGDAKGTPIQSAVIAAFEKALERKNVNIFDDFFSLGGDSLALIKLQLTLENAFSVKLPIEQIYSNSTVLKLSKILEESSFKMTSPIMASKDLCGEISFAQKRIWFLHQTQEKGLNIEASLFIKGGLDVDRLEAALNKLIEIHEILRTSYRWNGKKIFQYIHEFRPIKLKLMDVSDGWQQAGNLIELTNQIGSHRFNLEAGSIINIYLLKLGRSEFRLNICVHHIAVDAASLALLAKQLFGLYSGEVFSKEENRIRYLDYSRWSETEYLNDLICKGYWKKKLRNIPNPLCLQFDYPRPEKWGYSDGVCSIKPEKKLINKLRLLSENLQTTLFVVMLSAFQIQLSKLSGTHDILIGTDVEGRTHSQLEGVVGFFVNQLALRGFIDEMESVSELIKKNMLTHIEALNHQSMPFEKLVDLLEIERQNKYPPIFQVKLLLNYSPIKDVQVDGLSIEQVRPTKFYTHHDLTVSVDVDKHDTFNFNLIFNKALFKKETAERLLNNFMGILEVISSDLSIKVKDIPALTKNTLSNQQVINTRTSLSWSVIDYIENIAKLNPFRTAIVCGESEVNYDHLNKEANKLANFLLRLEVRPGSIIGVCLPASISQIVTVLAIMKVGASFLPLEPNYPASRIEFILADSMVDFIVSDICCRHHFNDFYGAVIYLNEIESILKDESSIYSSSVVSGSDNCAYVLYTSGSEGFPKGIMNSQKSLLNLCKWYKSFLKIDQETCLLQAIPLSFDASIKNILTPLMFGGKVLIPDFSVFDAARYLDLILKHSVGSLNCVPSFFYPILDLAQKGNFLSLSSLKHLALGGEAPNVGKLINWKNSPNFQCVISNIYGVTECSDISAAHILNDDDFCQLQTVPIGLPIDNTSIHIVDDLLEPVFKGEVGELVISGSGVGMGYIGQAKVRFNSARYVENSSLADGKLYRTGDLGKIDSAGNYIYIGRKDNSIKINGILIDFREIELAIEADHRVQDVKVVFVDDKIIAFVVSELNNFNGIKASLVSSIPTVSIPKKFIKIGKIPTLPNGKVDIVELKRMSIQEGTIFPNANPASNNIEEKLVNIWSDVLSLDASGIDVDESFFALGGDSILAVKMVSMSQDFGLNLSVADVFENQTVRKLANVTAMLQKSVNEVNQIKSEPFDMISDEDLALLNSKKLV